MALIKNLIDCRRVHERSVLFNKLRPVHSNKQHLCVFVCVFVCMFVCVFVCMFVSVFVCFFVCVFVCVFVYETILAFTTSQQ